MNKRAVRKLLPYSGFGCLLVGVFGMGRLLPAPLEVGALAIAVLSFTGLLILYLLGKEKANRVPRKTFWTFMGTLFAVALFIAQLTLALPQGWTDKHPVVFISLINVLMWPVIIGGVIVQVKRWHDLNASGWWVLLNAIPYLGHAGTIIVCGFIPGTRGPNRFGPDPLGRTPFSEGINSSARSWVVARITLWMAVCIIILLILSFTVRRSMPVNIMQDPDAVEGQEALQRKEGSTALKAFKRVELKYPENSLVSFWLGRSFAMLHDNSEAVSCYERAIRIDQNNSLAWMYLGATLNTIDPARSIQAAKKATELAPESEVAWYLLGLNYLSQKQPALAMVPLERAVQLNPDYKESWSSLSQAYLLVGDGRSAKARARAQELESKSTPPFKKDSAPLIPTSPSP